MKTISALLLPLVLVMALTSCNDASQEHDHQAAREAREARKVGNITWRDLSKRDTITLGDTSRLGFVYFNSGWKDVRLVECESRGPRCECKVPDRDLAIGGTDTLWVTSIPADTGDFVRYLDVTHNAPKQKPFLISLFLHVKAK